MTDAMTKLNPDALAILRAAHKARHTDVPFEDLSEEYLQIEWRCFHAALSAQPEQARTEGCSEEIMSHHARYAENAEKLRLVGIQMQSALLLTCAFEMESLSWQLVDARMKAAPSAAPRSVEQAAPVEVAEVVKVDRSARQLSGGGEITPDHRELKENGQQKGYVVLTPDERAKGFSRPYRDAYRHIKCGKITTMARDIAETYARDPFFYNGTFCVHCRGHFPIGEDGEFTWYEMDGREGPKVGT